MESDLFYRVSIDAAGAGYDLSGDLSSLVVDQREAAPDELTVRVSDPYKVLSHALQEGMEAEVELGTAADHSVVFRGRIYQVEGVFPEGGTPELTLRAFDHGMRMGLRRRSRVFTGMALSGVVAAVTGEYFSRTRIDVIGDPEFGSNGLRQDDETDLAFVLRLAEAFGCVVYVKPDQAADTLCFIAEQTVMSTPPEVTLYYGRTGVEHPLLRFESSADVSRIQLPRVLSGVDPDTGMPTSITTAAMPAVGPTEDQFLDENLTALREREPVKAAQIELLIAAAATVQAQAREELGASERRPEPTFTSDAELVRRAQNQLSTSLRGMRGSGATGGVKDLLARTAVAIEDVGGRFSGIWHLSGVRHRIDGNGYRTEFECRR